MAHNTFGRGTQGKYGKHITLVPSYRIRVQREPEGVHTLQPSIDRCGRKNIIIELPKKPKKPKPNRNPGHVFSKTFKCVVRYCQNPVSSIAESEKNVFQADLAEYLKPMKYLSVSLAKVCMELATRWGKDYVFSAIPEHLQTKMGNFLNGVH